MKRRHFLLAVATASAAPAASSEAESPSTRALALSTDPAAKDNGIHLAGYTLSQLQDIYHRSLFVDWLPFLEDRVIDPEYGGFLCDTDFDGTHASLDKNPLFEGRGVWVFSYLYTHFGRSPRYLEVAGRSEKLLAKSQPKNGDFWCTKIARDGSPSGPPGSTIPTDLGIAEGFAAYAQATGRQEYLDRSKQLLHKCVQAYDRPDYHPEAGRAYFGGSAPPLPGARLLGSWMLFLRTTAQILEIDQDPFVERIAHRCTDAVLHHHFNPAFRLNNELLHHDLSRPAGEYSQLANLGNTLEITWMLLDEASRRRDESMFDLCAERFRRHAEVAWDQVYDGFFHSLLNVDENSFQLNKLLWAQEEVLTDSLYIFDRRRAPWAADLFGRTYKYVREKFSLLQHGSPLPMYAAGRKVTFEEFAALPKRIENYHHPRQLMLNLRRIEGLMNGSHG